MAHHNGPRKKTRYKFKKDLRKRGLPPVTSVIQKFEIGDRVHVVVEDAEEGKARVSVVDQGPGLTEEDRRKLFGRFSKLSARPTPKSIAAERTNPSL